MAKKKKKSAAGLVEVSKSPEVAEKDKEPVNVTVPTAPVDVPVPAPKSDPLMDRVFALESKLDALCRLTGVSFKSDAGRLLAVR